MTGYRFPVSHGIVAAGAVLSLLPLTAASVRADAKILTETTITGLPEALKSGANLNVDTSKPVTSTLYIKGEKRRTETPGRVIIYDCAADAVYTLSDADKTYTMTTFAKNAQSDAGMDSQILSLLRIDTGDVSMLPQTASKTIAGKSATSYTFGMTLKMGPADASLSEMIPSLVTTVKGEQWVSESVAAPPACEKMAKANFMNYLPIPSALAGNGMKALSEKMAAIKGTPLSSRIEVMIKPGDSKAPDANVFPIPKAPIIVMNEVKSISEDPLADSLFLVPAGYKRVSVLAKPAPEAPTPAPVQAPDRG